ncbi:MAG: helix-turn-helix domain-containing protein [Verrucomicrobiota bacterium]
MHSTDTKSQFIELRAKGWSLARIAAQINVSPRTLVDWNRQSQAEIRTLRAVELEALQEKILATHEQELSRLTQHLQRIEEQLAKEKLELVSTPDLYRMAALMRAEIRKVRLEPDLIEPALASGHQSPD